MTLEADGQRFLHLEETLLAYVPADRVRALARGQDLPDRVSGAALFADVSGFTPLTEALARELGPQLGAEEMTRHLNSAYDGLIGAVERYGGSVVAFSGDAITCWFDDDGRRAIAAALRMQESIRGVARIVLPSGAAHELACKVSIVTGKTRRFSVGEPAIRLIDVLAGQLIDRLARAEHHARRGDVLVDAETLARLGDWAVVSEWRSDDERESFGVIASARVEAVAPVTAPPYAPGSIAPADIRSWLHIPVYARLTAGQGEFLSELRPAGALFLHFDGIDYENDPEAREKLDAFVREAQRIVGAFDGNVLEVSIGDKGSYLHIAVGAPVAHEDDAARAVSAALLLRDIPARLPFVRSTRAGIGYGRMRTGAVGSAIRRTYGAQGDETNLAARMMTAAAPGQILATQAAYQLVSTAFRWERLPDMQAKGKKQPVAVYACLGARERGAALEQDTRHALPLVGREGERDEIKRRIDQTAAGHGQIVAITGEAGIGKSRLLREALRMSLEHGLARFTGKCESYSASSAYAVWRNVWRDLLGAPADAPPGVQAESVVAALDRIDPALAARAPVLAPVLNLPIPDNDLTRGFDAKLRKSLIESLLSDSLRGLRADAPTLIVLEDCQWIDPLSSDLVEALGRAVVGLPVMIVLTSRPPAAALPQGARLASLPNFTEIALASLTAGQAEALARLALARTFGAPASASAALIQLIVARADGNPFYIEELLTYVRHRGIDQSDSAAVEQLELPNSLHSLILARIDRLLDRDKDVLRVASVGGRQFRAADLWGAFPQLGTPEVVTDSLRSLNAAELIVPESRKELNYLFRQIMTQEVTYESLPRETRANLHERLARYFETAFADAIDANIDLLALHYGRSDNAEKKRRYWMRAGEIAQGKYANSAAIDYYRRALPLLPAEEQTGAQLKLGQVLEVAGKWPEALAAYEAALALAEAPAERTAQSRCQIAIAEVHRKRGQYDLAALWIERARAGFEEIGDDPGVGQTLHIAGSLAAQQGDHARARDLYLRSLDIRRKIGDRAAISNLLSNLGIVARSEGDPAQARALHEESLAIRRELGDRRAIAVSLNNLGNVAIDQRNFVEARDRLQEAVLLQRQVGDKAYIANALNNLGNAHRALGEFERARKLYRESLVLSHELGDRWSIAYALEDLGVALAAAGEAASALRLIGAASALRASIGAPRTPVETRTLAAVTEQARASLDPEKQAEYDTDAQNWTLDEAVEYALACGE